MKMTDIQWREVGHSSQHTAAVAWIKPHNLYLLRVDNERCIVFYVSSLHAVHEMHYCHIKYFIYM